MAIRKEDGPDISLVRYAESDVLHGLGYLSELAGTWEGYGLNLIARPAFHYKALNNPAHQPDVFLQINFTRDHLAFHPIGSRVPNRGFQQGQDDVDLYGLTYLQRISDAAKPGIGAMHIEPGIWVHESPQELHPDDSAPPGGQVVTRMASIPHGNAILAQGVAQLFHGEPVFGNGSVTYNGSLFPSFNSTPFAAPPSVPGQPTFHAAGTTMAALAAANAPALPNFPQYTVGFALNDHDPGSIPANLTQAELSDPITVLMNAINQNKAEGYEFHGGTAINICTAAQVQFETVANARIVPPPPPAAPLIVGIPQFNGGTQNTVFLADRQPTPPPSGNALTQIVYATFWIEKLIHSVTNHEVLQLQYAQMVTLNFPAINFPPANLGWPHITVGTLRKVFA